MKKAFIFAMGIVILMVSTLTACSAAPAATEASPPAAPTPTETAIPTPSPSPTPTPSPTPAPVLAELHSIPDDLLLPEDEEDMVEGVEYVEIPEEYILIKGKSDKEDEEDSDLIGNLTYRLYMFFDKDGNKNYRAWGYRTDPDTSEHYDTGFYEVTLQKEDVPGEDRKVVVVCFDPATAMPVDLEKEKGLYADVELKEVIADGLEELDLLTVDDLTDVREEPANGSKGGSSAPAPAVAPDTDNSGSDASGDAGNNNSGGGETSTVPPPAAAPAPPPEPTPAPDAGGGGVTNENGYITDSDSIILPPPPFDPPTLPPAPTEPPLVDPGTVIPL